MTYVAEPYLYVADQILTGLTGGVARETHRFFAGANAFSFEVGADRVLVDSIRVIGQVNGAFFAFVPGRDFAVGGTGMLAFLASEQDPRQPARGATWPDEATEIYVSYYHADSFRAPLTDRNVGSLTRTLGEAFARELAVLRSQLEAVFRSGFVDTAEGPALDMVVALLGVVRKTREYASGTVRFFRDTPAPADVFIPAGTKVSTALPAAKPAPTPGTAAAKGNRPVSFVTAADRTLRRGQLAVEAPVRAEDKGPAGVVDARTIAVVNQPVLGVAGVTNDAPTVFGAAGESDDELRRRAKMVAERAGRATPRALLNALTELAAIRPNDVKIVEELQIRPGVVSVSVAADPTPQLAVDVHEAVLATRAAGIRVETNLDAFLPATPAAAASTGDARSSAPSGSEADAASPPAAPGDGFRLPLQARVVVFPDNPRITGLPRADLQQAVSDAVVSYIQSSSVGGVIVYNRLAADLMDIPGVFDVVVDIAVKGSAPTVPTKRNIYVAADRRATIDAAADLQVVFAGAPISFDFHAAVTIQGGATLDAIRKEMRSRLADYFAGPPAPTTVETTGLIAKLSASTLFVLAPEDLNWTAEYEQAGLIIRNQGGPGAATPITEADQAILRNLTIEEKT